MSVAPYYNSVVRFRFGYQITVNSQTSFSISYNYENNNGDTSINLKLVNNYFIEINPISETLTNGVKKYTYELNSGIYYIAVKVNAVDMLTPNVNFEFKKVGHTHHYDTAYLWFNLTKHKAFCSCGALTYQPHCVEIVNGNPGTTCLLCGGSASGGIIGPYGGLYFTENGSYICPNGTIVIAEEDLECFYSSEKKFKLFMDYEVTENQIFYFIENKKNVEDDVDENKNNI